MIRPPNFTTVMPWSDELAKVCLTGLYYAITGRGVDTVVAPGSIGIEVLGLYPHGHRCCIDFLHEAPAPFMGLAFSDDAPAKGSVRSGSGCSTACHRTVVIEQTAGTTHEPESYMSFRWL